MASNRREDSWHLSKNITISTLVGIFALITGQLVQYGVWTEKIYNLERQLADMNTETVPREVVEQMFITRDMKIIEVKEDIKENQKLLREILQKIHHHSE